MPRRPLLFEGSSLEVAFNEKIEAGDYSIVKELTPAEIEEFENLTALNHATERAFDRAYRSYENHRASNFLDMSEWYERASGVSRYDKVYQNMTVTRHNGKVVLVRANEDSDDK